MTPDPPLRRYGSARGFGHALKAALKARESHCTKTYNQLEREFYLQRSLARVFSTHDDRWVLKGGSNMLTRFPELARHSRDVDLLHRGPAPEPADAAVDDLRRLEGLRPDLDPFTFAVHSETTMTGGAAGRRMKVTVSFDATELAVVPIDLVTGLPMSAPIERHRSRAVAELPALAALPTFTLYPLPDQLADKICAMYERVGAGAMPSTRYRDLVDALIVNDNHEIDAAALARALAREATRRSLTLPRSVSSPGPSWHSGFPREARRARLPERVHALDTALVVLGTCLDPVLDRTVVVGTWDPRSARWDAADRGS